MHLLLVTTSETAATGRAFADALRADTGHRVTCLSERQFRRQRDTYAATQPILFLGEHDVAEASTRRLPLRFQAWGVTCHHRNGRAVLQASRPLVVRQARLEKLQRAIETLDAELEHKARKGRRDRLLWKAARFVLYLHPITRIPMWCADRYAGLLDRRAAYHDLQYVYAASRFLLEEWESFEAGCPAS